MKKFYSLLLCGMAACLLLWFAGCSTEQPNAVTDSGANLTEVTGSDVVSVNAAEAVLTETENGGLRTDLGCCLSPVIIFQSVTDTSVTLQICARSTGAVGGLVLQWLQLPVGNEIVCTTFPFPTTGVNQIVLPTPLAPFQCVLVTINGLTCETPYIFRAFAVNGQGCGSAPSNRICATTAECSEFLCPDLPGVFDCGTATSSAIALNVCAGLSGAPGGFEVQYAQLLSPTMVCADFVFDDTMPIVAFTDAAYLLGPEECAALMIEGLICETQYVFRIRTLEGNGFNCFSEWSDNLCCTTLGCEGGPGPCVDTPVITCLNTTPTTITVSVCAGPSGASSGIWLQYLPILNGIACEADMVWPTTGWVHVRPGPFAPNQCINVTLPNLLCETTYAFRAQALFCQPFECPSEWTDVLCCVTDDCEDVPLPNCVETLSFWRTHTGEWPVTDLMIGTVNYNAATLLLALNRSTVGGNAFAILVKQIIAAELNIGAGADDTPIAATLASAHTLIGGTGITMGFVNGNTATGAQMLALAGILERYNLGLMGVPHCL